MSQYAASGTGWLVCPALLELDARHASSPDKHPDCALGRPCIAPHVHEPELVDAGGHSALLFRWFEGSNHADLHPAELSCKCGSKLVHGDLDDPWAAELLAEVVSGGG